MSDAKLYSVQTMRGTVYVLHELSSGMIWTERSEGAARQLAQEKRFPIVGEESMSHAELRRLLGHEDPSPVKQSAAVGAPTIENDAVMVVDDVKPAAEPPKPITLEVRYHWDDEEPAGGDDAIVIPQSKLSPFSNVFCSDGALADSIVGQEAPDKAFDAGAAKNLPPKPIVRAREAHAPQAGPLNVDGPQLA